MQEETKMRMVRFNDLICKLQSSVMRTVNMSHVANWTKREHAGAIYEMTLVQYLAIRISLLLQEEVESQERQAPSHEEYLDSLAKTVKNLQERIRQNPEMTIDDLLDSPGFGDR